MKIYHPKSLKRKRNLPHWQQSDGVYFITFRLKNSLPKSIITQLQDEKMVAELTLKQRGLPNQDLKKDLKKLHHLYFGKFDEQLEQNKEGPHFLSQPNLAKIVADAILYFDNERYKVICFTIMSNHVHLVFYKLQKEIEKILGSIKRYSAREINLVRGTTGESVWTQESYDHIIRSRTELANWVTYTLNNPVKINLVKRWEDYQFNYLRKGFEEFYVTRLT